jgi:hypothetical protein
MDFKRGYGEFKEEVIQDRRTWIHLDRQKHGHFTYTRSEERQFVFVLLRPDTSRLYLQCHASERQVFRYVMFGQVSVPTNV